MKYLVYDYDIVWIEQDITGKQPSRLVSRPSEVSVLSVTEADSSTH